MRHNSQRRTKAHFTSNVLIISRQLIAALILKASFHSSFSLWLAGRGKRCANEATAKRREARKEELVNYTAIVKWNTAESEIEVNRFFYHFLWVEVWTIDVFPTWYNYASIGPLRTPKMFAIYSWIYNKRWHLSPCVTWCIYQLLYCVLYQLLALKSSGLLFSFALCCFKVEMTDLKHYDM